MRKIKTLDKVRLLPTKHHHLRDGLSDDTLNNAREAQKQAGKIATVEHIYLDHNNHPFWRRGDNVELYELDWYWPLDCLELVSDTKDTTAETEIPAGYYRTDDGFLTCDDNWTPWKRWF